ncbi:unnamed protein product, partial [marine sediment metagenome]
MSSDVEAKKVHVYAVAGPALKDEINKAFDQRFMLNCCGSQSELNVALTERIPDVMLLDCEVALGEDGLLERLKQNYLHLPIIVVAENPDVDTVVRCMRNGAYDFVSRSEAEAKLAGKVLHAAKDHSLLVQVNQLVDAYKRRGKFGELVGISPTMQTTYTIIENVAPTGATVFVSGESGTGKELVAKAIHDLSPRRENEFVPVNCAAIPKDLLESELFGHEKGSFTGAESRRIGSCERADEGTLFLDEICEMNLGLQSKLLRFLQDQTFTRVGGTETLKVDA